SIDKRDRIGLIGANGSGKSTLLKILAGLDHADTGTIEIRQDLRIEFLPQNPVFQAEHSVLEHIFYASSDIARTVRDYERVTHQLEENPDDLSLMNQLNKLSQQMDAMNAWEYQTRAQMILTKLGVVDFDVKMGTLSGGYRKRVALARALLDGSDLLMLDEPTNHLDADTVAWLEEYLENYRGAVLVVTHDRYFLDRVTNRILEIDRREMREYAGSFSYYVERKAEFEAALASQESKRQNILRKELEWLRRGAKARRTKQKAKIQRIETIQNITFERPREELHFGITARRLGTKVVEMKNLSKSFDDRKIIDNFSYTIERGQRLGVIGRNGAGKSTLANLITGKILPDEETVAVGETVYFGYYDQESTDMRMDERAIDYVKRQGGELIRGLEGNVLTAAAAMEQFNFTSQMMFAPIEKLSGGERRRLYLVRTLMKDPNFLILDEPTNDLDIATLESLEDFLDGFGGCLLVISHDRYFLDRTVDQLIAFEGNGKLRTIPGNYTTYERLRREEQDLERSQREATRPEETKKKSKPAPASNRQKKLSYMEKRELTELEEKIPVQENQLKDLEKQMVDAATDYMKLTELSELHCKLKEKLEADILRWETLASREEG
ncbi:MAG: ABC-F family ATP-binding cassette domain-containing protein, partial [Phycisphaerae bacterium]|nr:ABC-F family ATP-binding cassette domain-containing protein [Phycisphaerae bacterium]